MKKITLEAQKKILIDILVHIDNICRKNNIKYTLLGGSLIGAIRHNGIIPWDDDIDIALLPRDYKKLMNILTKSNGRYLLLNPETNEDYPYPCAKLVDTSTVLIENGLKKIENYGVYVDIFCYHFVSNNFLMRRIHYSNIIVLKKIIGISMLDWCSLKESGQLMKIMLYSLVNMIPKTVPKKAYLKLCSQEKPTNYVMSNWPAYGFKKEIQEAVCFDEFIEHDFEGIDAMISKKYDGILSTTFGNYMKLPPKSKRIPKHDTKAWWRKNDR